DLRLAIDSVNWGTPDQGWPNFSLIKDALLSPPLHPLDLGKDDKLRSWGRTPEEQDTNTVADWTVHETVSPGGKVAPIRLTTATTPLLNDWTNSVSAL